MSGHDVRRTVTPYYYYWTMASDWTRASDLALAVSRKMDEVHAKRQSLLDTILSKIDHLIRKGRFNYAPSGFSLELSVFCDDEVRTWDAWFRSQIEERFSQVFDDRSVFCCVNTRDPGILNVYLSWRTKAPVAAS
jgi:hypothetical protein